MFVPVLPIGVGPPIADVRRRIEFLGNHPFERVTEVTVVLPLALVKPVGFEARAVEFTYAVLSLAAIGTAVIRSVVVVIR